MSTKNDFPKRIEFVYNHFKKNHVDYGVSKPTKETFIAFLGVSRGKLQSWERGYWPKDDDLQLLSQKMRFSFTWLAFGTGDPFDTADVAAMPEAAASAVWPDTDPLQRLTQAIGIPEDAWSISDYLGIPAADAGAYLQQVTDCRKAQQNYRNTHPGTRQVIPPCPPLPDSWREAARRRYGVTPTWIDSGLGRSHEARDSGDTPELRTLRGMVDMLTQHGGTNEQVQELILNYGKRGGDGAETRDNTKKENPAQAAFL